MAVVARVVHRSPAATVLLKLGGRATRAQLLVHTTRHHVATALAGGEVVRAARGIYVTRSLPDPETAAARARGVLSHTTAAERRGLAMVHPPDRVHITVSHGAHPPEQHGVVYHRSRLAHGEVIGSVTSDVRTVLDCAVLLPLPDALAVADSALRLKRLTRTALLRAAEESRGPGRVRRLRVAGAADGAAANPFESALRALALSAGLGGATAQVAVLTHGGTFTVDVGDEDLRLALEADSFEWHGDRQALERDCRRYDELQRAGWTVLRFAWEHVMFCPDWVVSLIRDVRQRAEVATAPTRSRRDLLRAETPDLSGR